VISRSRLQVVLSPRALRVLITEAGAFVMKNAPSPRPGRDCADWLDRLPDSGHPVIPHVARLGLMYQ
jgi:hypothetical protein